MSSQKRSIGQTLSWLGRTEVKLYACLNLGIALLAAVALTFIILYVQARNWNEAVVRAKETSSGNNAPDNGTDSPTTSPTSGQSSTTTLVTEPTNPVESCLTTECVLAAAAQNEIHHLANQTLFQEDPTAWISQTPHLTLSSLAALSKTSERAGPAVLPDVIQILQMISSFNRTLYPSIGTNIIQSALNTSIAICDSIFSLDAAGAFNTQPNGNSLASLLYQTLESLHLSFPPAEQPYEIRETNVATYVRSVEVTFDSKFEDFQFANGLVVQAHVVAGTSLAANFTQPDSAWPSPYDSVSTLQFKIEALRAAFEKLRASLTDSPGVFSYSITALQRFSFGRHPVPEHLANRRARRISPLILSASIGAEGIRHPEVVTIEHSTDAAFKARHTGRRKYECVYLDYKADGGAGVWSSAGCRMDKKTSDWAKGTAVQCVCDHLTPFTLILDACGSFDNIEPGPDGKPSSDFVDPVTMTTVAMSISIACCLIVLFHLIWKQCNEIRVGAGVKFAGPRRQISQRKKVIFDGPGEFLRANFVVSLTAAYSFFIASQYVPESEWSTEAGCLAMAVISHWLMLVAFAWMALEAHRLFDMAAHVWVAVEEADVKDPKKMEARQSFRKKVLPLSWGLPLLFPFFALLSHFGDGPREAFDGEAYGCSERLCWLTSDHLIFLGMTFVLPVTCIAVANICAFAYCVYKVHKTMDTVQHGKFLPRARSALNMLATTGYLGAFWLLGYFTLFECNGDNEKYASAVIFIMFTAFQGVFILYQHCRQEGWDGLRSWWGTLSIPERDCLGCLKKGDYPVAQKRYGLSRGLSKAARFATIISHKVRKSGAVIVPIQADRSAVDITESIPEQRENSAREENPSRGLIGEGGTVDTNELLFVATTAESRA